MGMTAFDYLHAHPMAPLMLGLIYLVTLGCAVVVAWHGIESRAPRYTRSEQRPWP